MTAFIDFIEPFGVDDEPEELHPCSLCGAYIRDSACEGGGLVEWHCADAECYLSCRVCGLYYKHRHDDRV